MSYSVLLLGATGSIGGKIALKLAKYQDQLKRVAFMTPSANTGPEKEAKYDAVPIARVVGDYKDPASYRGFDIVISAVGDPLCEDQIAYIDAAFEGGVKHFYPAEFGADLNDKVARGETYFLNKVKVREHLEKKVRSDPSKGYTYILTSIFSDLMIYANILFLSEDKKSANFLGSPESMLTTTYSDDVASFTVLSLLPSHLKSLTERRQLHFEGTTLPISEYFNIVSRVLGHDIKVNYLSQESSYIYEEEQKALGNDFNYRFTSARRVLGYGRSAFFDVDNHSYPEVKPMTWEETVRHMIA